MSKQKLRTMLVGLFFIEKANGNTHIAPLEGMKSDNGEEVNSDEG